jgi:hypothetical protein
MKSGRIPAAQAAFIVYLVNVNIYLQTKATGDPDPRGTMLGMTTDELTLLDNFVKKFMSGDPANPGFWDLHSNADTKNKVTRANMLNGMKEFRTFFQPLLNRMSGSAVINSTDRLKLNIAEPVTSHSVTKTPIKEQCYTMVSAVGGGTAQVTCKWESDATRSSIPETADAVEIRYRLDAPVLEEAEEGSSEPPGKIIRETLSSPDDGTTKEIWTKSKFRLKFGADKAGFTLHVYARYIHTKRPGLEGDWTGPILKVLT